MKLKDSEKNNGRKMCNVQFSLSIELTSQQILRRALVAKPALVYSPESNQIVMMF